VLSVKYF